MRTGQRTNPRAARDLAIPPANSMSLWPGKPALRIALVWMSAKHASMLAGLGQLNAANYRFSARLGRRGDARLLSMRLDARFRQDLKTRVNPTLKFQVRRDPGRRRCGCRFRGRVICDFSNPSSFVEGAQLRVETHPMRIRRF